MMIKRMLRYVIVIIVTFAFVSSVYAIQNSNLFAPEVFKLKTIDLGTNLNANFGEVTDGKVIEQSFSAKQDGLTKVDLFFSTFNRKNNSETLLSLYEADTNQLIRQAKLNNAQAKDNAYSELSFAPVENSKGKMYILKITSNTNDPSQAVTFWKDNNSLADGNLSFAGKHQEGSLVGKLIYQNQFTVIDIIINGLFFSFLNIILFELLRFIKNK
ncbi:hypothetical protein [Paenibacillus lactis]|uniref:Uncharacterized protein n=1 Tax=Paenibacillus lactis TaxID=228574 RepID=A0ABS4F3Y0_9BACL|nr:hypothetical protein [Paenibacillus lactis]MBP1890951.1 hypothetical protein [Paenibacillus lactis]HAF99141.1 hypothetical protein [Paenibacillus lactis]